MTSIILNGANGKMSQKVAQIIKSNSEKFSLVCGVDLNNKNSNPSWFEIKETFPEDCTADAIIDFSHPSALDELLNFSKTKKIPLVIATTGYDEKQIEQIKNASKEIPIFFTFNMSLGINLLINLVTKSYDVLKDIFDIEIVEKHHNQKIDAPSGTAIMIADAINKEANGRFNYIYNRQNVRKKREKNEIGIHSIRAGTIVGEHEVIFSGEDETISISHTAMSKNVFAIGALKAAEFLKNKETKLYDMNDLINNS